MKEVGSHRNIVNMLGCCTSVEPLFLVVEYLANGDLLNYLRKRRNQVCLKYIQYMKYWTSFQLPLVFLCTVSLRKQNKRLSSIHHCPLYQSESRKLPSNSFAITQNINRHKASILLQRPETNRTIIISRVTSLEQLAIPRSCFKNLCQCQKNV